MDGGVLLGVGQLLADWPGLRRPKTLALEQFLDCLAIPPLAPPAVLEVAKRAHATPYPPNWSEQIDAASGGLYFYNEVRSEATWAHPVLDTFREVLDLVQALVEEKLNLGTLAARVEETINEAARKSAEELADWVGPLAAEAEAGGAEEFWFYNRRTLQSEWEDPREQQRYHLQVRYELLVGFLVAEERSSLAKFGNTPSDLTPTLTSLASSMSSVTSLLETSMTTPQAAREAGGGGGDDGDGCWARPRASRRGQLPLPPRATSRGSQGGGMYAIPPHQRRYATDVLGASDGSPTASRPPPPPGSPPGRR